MAEIETSPPPERRVSWFILGGIFLSLPLAYVGLRVLFDFLGIDFHVQYVVLGLWLGLGVAAALLFGSRLTGGHSVSASRFASARWLFVVWGIVAAALVAWAVMGAVPGEPAVDRYRGYLPVVQVFLTIAVAIWILRNRHRGRRFIILAIIAGAALIALFAAATGYFL